jgi:hypothetical protein
LYMSIAWRGPGRQHALRQVKREHSVTSSSEFPRIPPTSATCVKDWKPRKDSCFKLAQRVT